MAELSSFIDQLREAGKNLIASAKDSLEWYKDRVNDLVKRDPTKLFKKASMPQIGGMYLFVYDPKYKATLPFYDAFPLVIPIEFYTNGFLGLNLHYLDTNARSSLLDALVKVRDNDKYDETSKLNVSYRLLKGYANQFPGHEVCIKRYLFEHVRSSFNYVNPSDWVKVISMPSIGGAKWKVNPNSKYAGSPPY